MRTFWIYSFLFSLLIHGALLLVLFWVHTHSLGHPFSADPTLGNQNPSLFLSFLKGDGPLPPSSISKAHSDSKTPPLKSPPSDFKVDTKKDYIPSSAIPSPHNSTQTGSAEKDSSSSFSFGSSTSSAGNEGRSPQKILDEIAARVRRSLRYPTPARAQRQNGIVKLGFHLTLEGQPIQIHLIDSSSFDILDQEALAALQRAAPYPYIEGEVRIPVSFELED